jgi:methyl coenzyme M reductase subunit D
MVGKKDVVTGNHDLMVGNHVVVLNLFCMEMWRNVLKEDVIYKKIKKICSTNISFNVDVSVQLF